MMKLFFAVYLVLLPTQDKVQSKVTFCKLDEPQMFEGKAGLIDAIRIIRVDNLNTSDATIVYEVGWQIFDENGIMTQIKNPNGQIQTWRWNDEAFAKEAGAPPVPGLSRGADLLFLFYKYLAASKSEYSCTLVPQNVN